jgi:hypothetical protein
MQQQHYTDTNVAFCGWLLLLLQLHWPQSPLNTHHHHVSWTFIVLHSSMSSPIIDLSVQLFVVSLCPSSKLSSLLCTSSPLLNCPACCVPLLNCPACCVPLQMFSHVTARSKLLLLFIKYIYNNSDIYDRFSMCFLCVLLTY